jgi:chorismate mutase/prephenate dehydratase
MRLKTQRKPLIAYLGPKGTFCEQAAKKYFSSSRVTFIPYPSIGIVFDMVEKGRTEYGVVPVENSLDGSVRLTLDRLLITKMMVSGEVEHRIIHNLIAKSGTRIEDINSVVSHPQALAQCRLFLKKELPNAQLQAVNSTAKAVELLNQMNNAAAIGTDIAAKNNKMVILAQNIEDHPNNFTRFFILSKKDNAPTGSDKTSLIFSVKDAPGALYKILKIFAMKNINLTKIESRPERGKPWKYIFYLDFEGHRKEAKNRSALDNMEKQCIFLKVIGSYPRSNS